MAEIYFLEALGIFYIFMGIGFVLNPMFYKQVYSSFLDTKAVYILGAIMAFVFGYVAVAFGATLENFREVILLILGILGLAKAFIMLVFPRVMEKLLSMIIKSAISKKMFGIILVVIGILLFGASVL